MLMANRAKTVPNKTFAGVFGSASSKEQRQRYSRRQDDGRPQAPFSFNGDENGHKSQGHKRNKLQRPNGRLVSFFVFMIFSLSGFSALKTL